MRRSTLIIALASLAVGACSDEAGGGGVRDQIRIVGSSTVYPFSTAVSEKFAQKNPGFKSPIVESTGTGAGMKLFCRGVGAEHPDIEDASRRIKASEYADCAKNGVTEVIELQIGIDGIAFAEATGGPNLKLTVEDIYKALAATPFGKPQTAKTWKDVNPALPAIPIVVYGPPSTSGTRDALAELILAKGCDSDPAMKALKASDEEKHKTVCQRVREDEAYIPSGENDNLIVQKIAANPNAIGVFGYSFLEENRDRLKDVPLNGIMATYATISDFTYPGARPLYLYVKGAHLKAIPGLREFVAEYASAIGQDGYLKTRDMITAPADVIATTRATAQAMTPLDPKTLK